MAGDADEGLRGILIEQVDRLLSDAAGPAVLRAAERGEWPDALWAEAEALGLPLALAPETMGGAGLGWEDAVAVWQVLGRHGAPLPLAHGMAAAALLGLADIEPPAGFIALALPNEPVAWGRRAGHVAAVDGAGQVALHDGAGVEWRRGEGAISREPADRAASFGAPLRAWVTNDLGPLIDDVLLDGELVGSGFLRRPTVQQMVAEQRSGRTDQSKQLWQLLSMELWYRGARAAGVKAA